jgi:DNA-directed RNA polymerase I, II, and III subunit RPABC5
MIIPVKCVTCGKVLANKYRYYLEQVRQKKQSQMGTEDNAIISKTVYLTKENTKKTAEGEVLDDLGLTDPCCRRHILTHVDIE